MIINSANIGLINTGLQNITNKNMTSGITFSKQFDTIINAERYKISGDDNLLMNDADLSELPTLPDCEISKAITDDSTSQNENDEAVEAESDIIFDMFEHCYECEDRENCAHYLGMTGADEEEIENAILKSNISNNAFNKVGNIVQEQLYSSIKSSILYNYNIICPDIEKKPKRDK